MKTPTASENLIKGSWKFEGGRIVPDEICNRIHSLLELHFKKLAQSREFGAWEILYIDPTDGRFWELTYPEGHMQGGGPPQISVVGENQARSKYDF